jgi:hypothetical protein
MFKSKTGNRWPMLALGLSMAAFWPGISHADRSMGVSKVESDARTTFIWVGEEKNQTQARMMISIQNGGATYGTNLTGGGVDITFAKSEMSQIRWCTYMATEEESMKGTKTCKADKPLKPGGQIKIP